MSSEWKEQKLSELCNVTSSKRIFAHDYVDSGIPFYRSKDVIDKSLGSFASIEIFISEKRFNDIAKKFGFPKEGDLLLSSVGNRSGIPYVVQKEGKFYFKDGNLTWFKDFNCLNSSFLYYWLKSDEGQSSLNSIMIGSAQKALTISGLSDLRIKIPSLESQNNIVLLLRSLDDRIILLRETNTTLEAIAQALFKSWFVDFDPVRAKQEGLEPEGMDADTAALFPDSFEESELGLVPKGWKLVPFGELLCHTTGGDWGSDLPDEINDTRVAIIRGTDIPDLQSASNSRVPIRYTSQKKLNTRKLQDGDIVLEVSGGSKDQPTGRALYLTDGLLGQFDCPVEPASFCRLLRPTSRNIGMVLGQHLTFIYAQGKTWEYQNQSTGISNFQTTHFLKTEFVVLPPESILSTFADTIRPMIDRSHLTQISQLATLRDTLLPRLISGQLRLPDAEALIEEATA